MIDSIRLWAHRGSGKGLLENTLKGFDIAYQAGFRAVEFDVMLSADGVPMVHHDWQMGRCAKRQSDKVGFEPYFGLLSRAEIAEYQVTGEAVPTFSEVIEFCLQHGLTANVELKATNPANAIALGLAVLGQVSALSQNQQRIVQQNWVFSSFYHASLLPCSGLKLALLYEVLPSHWSRHASALGVQAIHLHHSGVSPSVIRQIHTTGRAIRIYTVNDMEHIQAWQKLGVEGVFTDNMELLE